MIIRIRLVRGNITIRFFIYSYFLSNSSHVLILYFFIIFFSITAFAFAAFGNFVIIIIYFFNSYANFGYIIL